MAEQAQQPAGVAGTPTEMPTKKDPLRFTAFNVSMPTGVAGVTDIVIERWTTVEERTALLKLVETAKYGEGGQRKLLNALQKVKPRSGTSARPTASAGTCVTRLRTRWTMAAGSW